MRTRDCRLPSSLASSGKDFNGEGRNETRLAFRKRLRKQERLVFSVALRFGKPRPVRLARPRTQGFHPCNRGSNPLRDANFDALGNALSIMRRLLRTGVDRERELVEAPFHHLDPQVGKFGIVPQIVEFLGVCFEIE